MAIIPWCNEAFDFSFPTAIFFISLLILCFRLKSPWKRNSNNLPPCPPKLPVIGNLHQLGNLPHLSLRRLSDKFGPIIQLQLGQIPTVVISSAKLAKQALKINDVALSSRPLLFTAKHLLYNCTDMGFAPYGSHWRHIRKICTLELLSTRRVQYYSFVREDEVALLVHRIAQSSYPETIDLTKLFELYANDVICRMAFGRDFSEGEYDRHQFQKILHEFQVLLGGFSVGDFFPSLEFILHRLTGLKSRLIHTFKSFDQLLDQIISEHQNPKRRKEENKDLVDVLLDIHKNGSEDGVPLTLDNVKAIILDMFAAGTNPTFIILDWGMTELITNPKVMERVQNEIRSIVGSKRVVSENDLSQMPYLKAVIKEILRLHPPAPLLLPRESTEDITIDGYDIPTKTRIFVNAWAIGRDPKSWEDPEKFNPGRFLASNIDFTGHDFEFIPFGAGRRICPAVTMATATIELALAQLLHSFDWELPNGTLAKDLDMTESFGISIRKIAHLVVAAKPYFGSSIHLKTS